MSKQNRANKTKSNTQGGQVRRPKQQKQNLPKPVSVPVATAKRAQTSRPTISQNRSSIRVRHREYIGNLEGQAEFTIRKTLELNPGLPATFPWLSGIANNWDEYTVHGLRVEVIARCGSNTSGSVIISPDYDASDAAPISEAVMTTFEDTVEDAPWKDMVCFLRPPSMKGGMTRKFIRSLPLAPNQDIKTYDVGKVFLATVGGPPLKEESWSKVWISYDIEFFVPSLHSSGSALAGGKFLCSNPTNLDPIASAIPLGTTSGVKVDNGVMSFPLGGDYQINLNSTRFGGGITGIAPEGLTGPGALHNGLTFVSDDGDSLLRNLNISGTTPETKLSFGEISTTGGEIGNSALTILKAIQGSLAA